MKEKKEGLLLKERWSLLQSGVDKADTPVLKLGQVLYMSRVGSTGMFLI